MSKLGWLHPFLFAVYPILYVYGLNVALVPLPDVFVAVAIAWAAIAILVLLAVKFTKKLNQIAAILSGLLLFCFSFPMFQTALRSAPVLGDLPLTGNFFLISWAIVALLLTLALWKLAARESTVKFLNLAAVALVAISLVSVGTALASTGQSVKSAAGKIVKAGTGGKQPDIFYIILDGYARTDTLTRVFDWSNKPFLDHLAGKGFFVADQSHSNYVQTELSLTSSLNLEYLPTLLPNLDTSTRSRNGLAQLIDKSRVSQTLQARGYTFFAIGSGFPQLRFDSADYAYLGPGKSSQLPSLLIGLTPFSRSPATIESAAEMKRQAVRSALQTLKTLARPSQRPRFVFAHLLAPHPPFVFNPDGSDRQAKGAYGLWDGSHFFAVGGSLAEYTAGYRSQAQFISNQISQAVDSIVAANPEAIVVIQGDHGSKSHLDQGSLAKTDVNEAFGILNCYRVPPKVRQELYPSISPVNTFRLILNDVAGEENAELPDRSYYSPWERPFDFSEVTEELK